MGGRVGKNTYSKNRLIPSFIFTLLPTALVYAIVHSDARCFAKRGMYMVKKNDLIKGNIDSLLLCVIVQQPMYGYQIIKELERRSKGYFKFKEGTLYPALHRLEKAGLSRGEWQTLPNGRQRRYYHITEKGLQSLVAKKDQWLDFLKAMNLIIQPVSE
jgi:PadR family transcriptional regulator PadR